jgi:hypothetical protein
MSAIQWTTSSMHHILCYDYMFWLTASVVITLYSKDGGKNGKHAGVPPANHVGNNCIFNKPISFVAFNLNSVHTLCHTTGQKQQYQNTFTI